MNVSVNTMKPIAAILLYRGEAINSEDNDVSEYYAESLMISDDGKFNNPIPLAKSSLTEIAKLAEYQQDHFFCQGILPKNLVHLSNNKIVWIRKEQKTNICYSDGFEGICWQPELVFSFDGNLTVYPHKKGKLYKYPYSNQHGASICMGSFKFKFESYEVNDAMPYIESAFFNTIFTGSSTKWKKSFKTQEKYKYPKKSIKTINDLI